jgi:hypothetical protein
MSPAEARLAAAITADLLDQGRAIDRATTSLVAAGVVATWIAVATGESTATLLPLAAMLPAGAAQAVLALRVGFDAALFRRLADAPDLAAFDAAMTGLGLLPAAKAGRPLAARAAGARRLLVAQGLCLAAVLALPLLALWSTLP